MKPSYLTYFSAKRRTESARVSFRALLAGSLLISPSSAASWVDLGVSPTDPLELSEERTADGHPDVHLNKLVFPKNIVGAPGFEKHLTRSLKREVYRADWGAGRENRIEYRFEVTELKFTLSDGALRIKCSAIGRLPGGRRAKSQLSFGGSALKRTALTNQVLEIVARGVVTRLAELERKRRGLR